MAAAGPSPWRRSLFGVGEVAFAGVGTLVRGGDEVSQLGGGRSGIAIAGSGKPSDFRRWRRLLRREARGRWRQRAHGGAWAESARAWRRPALAAAAGSRGRQGRGRLGSPPRHFSLVARGRWRPALAAAAGSGGRQACWFSSHYCTSTLREEE
uniref:Uncharacterized protein n=1 Tax=Oryza sativa subsp. japonica TaxID=39947 RepID=Q654L7_ORYSJ|nr:hypothetical protein [Oryza sativa Japonica Group]